jgi:protein gp37
MKNLESVSLDRICKHYGIAGIHPAAEILPLAADDDFEVIQSNISATGIIEPIKVDSENLLIDGRNRLRAAWFLGLKSVPIERINPEDVLSYVISENIARRHLTVGQKAMLAAKIANIPQGGNRRTKIKLQNSKLISSSQAAEFMGLGSNSHISRARRIQEWAPAVGKKVEAGNITLDAAYQIASQNKKQSEALHKPERQKPCSQPIELTGIIDKKFVQIPYPKPAGKHQFNRTNDAVDWASWTWNPVTGCLHGCPYCYAREMAYRESYAASYPIKFAPLFHHERLNDPVNTTPGTERVQDSRVFVCSMADLFGEWVPQKWIDAVFDAALDAPAWEYLFLTKFPQRYRRINLPPRCWFGASVDQQKRVKITEKVMPGLEVKVRWISVEPMLEPLKFNDLSWCDLVVIGAQSETNQPTGYVPAFAPKLEWVIDLIAQARAFDCPVYLKPNLLGELTGSKPGMVLPQEGPRQR